MAQKKISFNQPINSTLQVGDAVWVSNVDPITNATDSPERVGVVDSIFSSYIIVEVDSGSNIVVIPNMFLMFSKPIEVNESSIKGYYADVTLENASKKYAELFAISSEVAISSK